LIFNQKENLNPYEILKCFDQFESYLEVQYQPTKIHRELPISGEIAAVQFQGFVDLVIERADDLILIDYKSFALKRWHEGAYRKKALEYSGQLNVYSKLLEQVFGKPVSEAAIYFVVMGKMVVVDL
jgi:ATP-dependent exoDNAse (exonuclease V) beta subunit